MYTNMYLKLGLLHARHFETLRVPAQGNTLDLKGSKIKASY